MATSKKSGVSPWYLSGGVSQSNCICAYQPIGAASLAASYTNLANPGTYNAAPGTAPTFDTATGWTFAGSEYLLSGITLSPGTLYSVVARYSNFSGTTYQSGALVGVSDSTPLFRYQLALIVNGPSVGTQFLVAQRNANGSFGSGAPPSAAVVAMAGLDVYRDGSSLGSIASSTAIASIDQILAIGARRIDGAQDFLLRAKIQAVAIYDTILSAAQVAAISAAMAAL